MRVYLISAVVVLISCCFLGGCDSNRPSDDIVEMLCVKNTVGSKYQTAYTRNFKYSIFEIIDRGESGGYFLFKVRAKGSYIFPQRLGVSENLTFDYSGHTVKIDKDGFDNWRLSKY